MHSLIGSSPSLFFFFSGLAHHQACCNCPYVFTIHSLFSAEKEIISNKWLAVLNLWVADCCDFNQWVGYVHIPKVSARLLKDLYLNCWLFHWVWWRFRCCACEEQINKLFKESSQKKRWIHHNLIVNNSQYINILYTYRFRYLAMNLKKECFFH